MESNQKKLHDQLKTARSQIKAGESSKGVATYFKIAQEMVLSGDITKATATYKLILKEEPNNPMAQTFLANLYHHQGLEAEALQLSSPENSLPFKSEDFSFETIGLSEVGELKKLITLQKVAAKQKIISQNHENNRLYLITEGHFQVIHQETGKLDTVVTTLGKGHLFGELTMLLPHRKASATIIASEPGKLLTISRDEFKHFLKIRPALLESLITKMHKRLLEFALKPLLISENGQKQLWTSRLAEAFKVTKFSNQEHLMVEGEKNHSLYVILDGDVEISIKGSQNSNNISVTTLTTGDFFGEFSLLTGEAASASVKALSNGCLAILEKDKVDQLATHYPEFLPRIISSFRARKLSLLEKKIGSFAIHSSTNNEAEGLND